MSLLDDVSIVVTPNGYKAGELYAVKPTFALGSELVTNSIFNSDNTSDWGNGFYDSFTFDSSEGGFYNLQRVTADARTNINLSSVLTVGKRYKVTVVARGSGNIKTGLTSGGYGTQPSAVFTLTSSFASYSTIVTVTSSLVYGVLWNDDGNSNIDYQSYSVKEYTSADMDVTRETAATRVDEDGLVNYAEVISETEEVINGDFATDSDWSKGGGATISGGQANIDGDGTFFTSITQSNVFTEGKRYKVTTDVIITSGLGLKFQDGANNENIGFATTTGSYEFYFTATSNTSFVIGRRTGGTAFDSSVDNVSVKELTRDNVPRIDYTGGGCPHILSEPQRTNEIVNSNTSDFGVVRSARGVQETKLGIIEGYKYSYTSANPNINKNYSESTLGYKTLSVYFDATNSDYCQLNLASGGNGGAGAQVLFTPSTQTFGSIGENATYVRNSSANFESLGNNIYRVMLTTEFISYLNGTTFPIIYFGNNSNVWIGGVQVEQSSYETSYIPTSGSTVTRNQDIFTRDGIGSLINSTEGVLFAEMAAFSNDLTYRTISLNNGTNDECVRIRFKNSSNSVNGLIRNGGSARANISHQVSDIKQFHKLAFKYKSGDSQLWVDGVKVGTSTDTFALSTQTQLNFNQGTSSDIFYGKVRQLQVYNTVLTDEQLLQLTGTSGTDFYESYAEMASALTYTIQ